MPEGTPPPTTMKGHYVVPVPAGDPHRDSTVQRLASSFSVPQRCRMLNINTAFSLPLDLFRIENKQSS